MHVFMELLSTETRTLTLLLLVLALTHALQYGVVTPQDPFIFEGDPLRLYCNITNPSVRENSSSLFFEKGVERRASQELNTRAIRLIVPVVSLGDEGSYTCLVRTMEGKVKDVGTQRVKVDRKPRQVVNVTCSVYNWEEMTCTWDMAIRYRHPDNVNVSLFWVTTDVQQDCPWLSNNSCHWDRDHYMHGQRYSIRIAVTYSVKGHTLDQASKMIHVNTVDLVTPAPVHELRASATNSTCILLTWQIPRVMYREKSFVKQIRTPGKPWKDINLAPSSQIKADHSSHSALVCDLERNSPYEFRVAVMPLYNGWQKGSISDFKTISAYTEEDVPSAAPSICSGCFFDISNTEQDTMAARKVRIMWRHIPKASRHGTLTHYKISYWSLTSHYANKILSYVINQDKSGTSVDLNLPSRREDYRVSIVGATRVGESRNASLILIPAMKNKPEPPQRFLVKRNREERESGRLFLSWEALDTRHVRKRSSAQSLPRHAYPGRATSGLYIVWCAGSRNTWKCQEEPKWVRLPPGQVTYELVTNKTQVDPYDFLIGISVEVKVGHEVMSSGIHWSTCVYTRNQKPKTSPQDVRFSQSTTEDSLVVMWRKPGCREETAYITEYLIKYCPSSTDNKCVGDRLTMNASGDATSTTLPRLATNTKYLVYVVAVSSAGLGPPSNDIWRMVQTKTPEEDLSGLILIVVAIMCALIVVTSCVCFIRCCYTKNQKMPTVDGLLETQPPQKRPAAQHLHHHRDRPLPEPPSEALVEHHTYGRSTSSSHACM
ncbi:cytokine receptor, partial [Elysia marginata]